MFRYGRWGALLGFGLLAMVYTHFAFMPTGYEKFEKKHLDAPRRIENVVALPTRPATQRGENAGEESKTEDQGSETPPVEEHPVDLAVGLERFGSTWGGAVAGILTRELSNYIYAGALLPLSGRRCEIQSKSECIDRGPAFWEKNHYRGVL